MHSELMAAIDQLEGVAADMFARIGTATADATGVTRHAYGPFESAAAQILQEYAVQEGLQAGYDKMGNLQISLPATNGENTETIFGSHLDSVPRGGNYDGLAGVVAGLVILVAIKRSGVDHGGYRTIGFRCEESPWFGIAYVGSKLFLGRFSTEELHALKRFDTGLSLAEHLRGVGAEPDGYVPGTPQIPLERIKAYYELHIEQGPLLLHEDLQVGLATAIRGNIRHRVVRCVGEFGHPGAVPRHLRSDTLLATADLLHHADLKWADLVEEGDTSLVMTSAIIQSEALEHAAGKIPGELSFTLSIDGTDGQALSRLAESIYQRAAEISDRTGVTFSFSERVGTSPVSLDGAMVDALKECADDANVRATAMPTVGHDAAMFAQLGVRTGVVLVRNYNGSHSPDEHMELSDFMSGVRVMALASLRAN